jgi:hypothetical protein
MYHHIAMPGGRQDHHGEIAMRLSFLIAGLLFSQMSFAAPANSQVDLFYGFNKMEVDGTSGSADGGSVGLRLRVGRSWPLVTAEYERGSADGSIGGVPVDADIEIKRLGLGLRLAETGLISAWLRGEYLQTEYSKSIALDDDGFAGHVGFRLGSEQGGGYVEFGAISANDSKGSELKVGAAIEPANYGFFIEYRSLVLDPEAAGFGDIELTGARIGARWKF